MVIQSTRIITLCLFAVVLLLTFFTQSRNFSYVNTLSIEQDADGSQQKQQPYPCVTAADMERFLRKNNVETSTSNAHDGPQKQEPRCVAAAGMERVLQKHAGKNAKNTYRTHIARMINEIQSDDGEPVMKRGAEVGVFKAQLSSEMLSVVTSLEEYILVDPWKHLDDWNMPFNNNDDEQFKKIFEEAMSKTKNRPEFADKVTVVREVSVRGKEFVEDESLDFVYIDGDHTAKGAMLDVLSWLPKVRCGGLVMGDDYLDSIDFWGKGPGKYDPIMVKSAVDAVAESLGVRVYVLAGNNWAFIKPTTRRDDD